MPNEPLRVTEDRLLGGRVRLAQPASGYRVAIDPVLLAAASPAAPGARVLDFGCGVGAAALCLLARCPGVAASGIEIQPDLAALARRNARDNGWEERFQVVEGSALAPPPELGDGFDWVLSNPPYFAAGRGTAPPAAGKARAHVESGFDLGQWVKAAARLLAPRGHLVVVHRAERLADLLAALAGRGLGEVTVLPVWPKAGRAASRVIVRARKGSRAPFCLRPGLVLHGPDGTDTPEARAVLRDAAGLVW